MENCTELICAHGADRPLVSKKHRRCAFDRVSSYTRQLCLRGAASPAAAEEAAGRPQPVLGLSSVLRVSSPLAASGPAALTGSTSSPRSCIGKMADLLPTCPWTTWLCTESTRPDIAAERRRNQLLHRPVHGGEMMARCERSGSSSWIYYINYCPLLSLSRDKSSAPLEKAGRRAHRVSRIARQGGWLAVSSPSRWPRGLRSFD